MTAENKTYRDCGWQEPKFVYSQLVRLVHQPDDLIKDMRILLVVNYWRAYNGDFGYNLVPAPGEDTSKDEGEGFEHWENELEHLPDDYVITEQMYRNSLDLLQRLKEQKSQ